MNEEIFYYGKLKNERVKVSIMVSLTYLLGSGTYLKLLFYL